MLLSPGLGPMEHLSFPSIRLYLEEASGITHIRHLLATKIQRLDTYDISEKNIQSFNLFINEFTC